MNENIFYSELEGNVGQEESGAGETGVPPPDPLEHLEW